MKKRRQRSRTHRSLKLWGCICTVAILFIAGMAVEGGLSQRSLAEAAHNWGFGGSLEESLPSGKRVMLEIPCIDQREKYPTGCESVTAVMALRYAGVEVSVEEFIDWYLPMSETPWYDGSGGYFCADPREAFLGSPYSPDGWGCYAPVIKTAAEMLITDKKASLTVTDLTGTTLEELCREYIAQGVPVILWSTMYMTQPQNRVAITVVGTGQQTEWVSPEHCLLLVGMDGESYWFNDPLEGTAVAYERTAVEQAYEALGQQALAIMQH